MEDKKNYTVSKKCKNCGQVDEYYFTKKEVAFWKYGDVHKKKCSQCGSSEFEFVSYPSIEVDEELMKEWSIDETLYFLSQDEEIFLAEKRYIDLIIRFLDDPDILLRKRRVLIESLYVIIYDILEGLAEHPLLTNVAWIGEKIEKTPREKEADSLILQKIKKALLERKHLLIEADEYIWQYLREVVYPFLGIQFEMIKIKVCGMKNPENILELSKLPVNFMGLIFYPKSPRYAGDLELEKLNELSEHYRVGVFVNEDPEIVTEKIHTYKLTHIQLHGNESVEYCKQVSDKNRMTFIIKAFSIADISDLKKTEEYEGVCSYFLFDTKTSKYGGSGQKFDWDILNSYQGENPFFLSGGISPEDAEEIKKIQHPKLYGLDLNSRFETEPGIKNISLIEEFIKRIKDEPN